MPHACTLYVTFSSTIIQTWGSTAVLCPLLIVGHTLYTPAIRLNLSSFRDSAQYPQVCPNDEVPCGPFLSSWSILGAKCQSVSLFKTKEIYLFAY